MWFVGMSRFLFIVFLLFSILICHQEFRSHFLGSLLKSFVMRGAAHGLSDPLFAMGFGCVCLWLCGFLAVSFFEDYKK